MIRLKHPLDHLMFSDNSLEDYFEFVMRLPYCIRFLAIRAYRFNIVRFIFNKINNFKAGI